MDKYIYKSTINLAIKVSLFLIIFFIVMGVVRSFANTNEEYIAYYGDDRNFQYRFKQFYISGYGSITSFATILHKNSNYLKYQKGCIEGSGLPLYDSLGNPVQNIVDNKDIPGLCNIIYDYDVLNNPVDYTLISEKMNLDIEGGNSWGFAIGLNTHSAFRTEIAYNSLFKAFKKEKNINGHGTAIAKIDRNNYNISFQSRSLFINTYFDVLEDRRESPIFVPYIMVGGGITDNRISVEYQANPTNPATITNIPSIKNFNFAFNSGIGFSSSVTNYIVLDISARYYYFGKVKTENYYIQNNIKTEFQGLKGKIGESYQIMMGIRFQI